MGIFVDLYGERKIPENKREEFSKRIQTIFEKGGLMNSSYICMYDTPIYLLKPAKFDMFGQIRATYSYFSQSFHEECGYNLKDNDFFSGKVGAKYMNVVYAINILYQFYTEDFSIANIDGDVFLAEEDISWLNYLFNEKYSYCKLEYVFEFYRILLKSKYYREYADEIAAKMLNYSINLYQINAYKAVSDFKNFQKLILENENYKTERNIQKNINEYYKSNIGSKEEKLEKLKSLFFITQDDEKSLTEDEKIIYSSIIAFPVICMKFISELFQIDFWEFYYEIYSKNSDLLLKDFHEEKFYYAPLTPINTAQFFKCSYDDMAYFWTKDNDIVFSDEMESFIAQLKSEFDNILNTKNTIIEQQSVIKEFIFALKEANIISKTSRDTDGVFPTEAMFYEFIDNSNKREIQAFIYLLIQLNKKYKYKDIKKQKKVSRYLWILSNSELRKLKFGY